MVKKGGCMKVRLKRDVMMANLEVIRNLADERGLEVSFMIKHQLRCTFIFELLKGEKVYTNTCALQWWENIYSNKRITVVDAFDRREGITMDEANMVKDKNVAMVNFCCCNKVIPSVSILETVSKNLHQMGFKRVSFGGSFLLNDKNCFDQDFDEIRVGEALLTGYSSLPDFETYFDGMANPFELELRVWSSSSDGVVVRYGFMELGGFTDIKTKCVNTDFSVLDVKDWRKYKKGDLITVKPDYYTLIRIANNCRSAWLTMEVV